MNPEFKKRDVGERPPKGNRDGHGAGHTVYKECLWELMGLSNEEEEKANLIVACNYLKDSWSQIIPSNGRPDSEG